MTVKIESFEPAGTLTALSIDLRSSLAFGRAALKAVSALSPEAHASVIAALHEEAEAVRIDDIAGSAAVIAVIDETRRWLAAD